MSNILTKLKTQKDKYLRDKKVEYLLKRRNCTHTHKYTSSNICTYTYICHHPSTCTLINMYI